MQQNIGRFQLIRQIGRGAAATVYEAFDPRIGRSVALKVLTVVGTLEGAARREAIERFYREARLAGKLSHPNIAQIYDVGEDAGRYYIAMELCSGVSLRDVLRFEGRLSEQRVKNIALQVLSALEAAHAEGIVHRDIKPENIIVAQGDQVKLTDFGIAKALSGTTMTQTGTMLGTPAYMSPEQVLGKDVDARSDLFSLGTVLYECLSGRKPFDGDSITAVTHKIAYVDPEPLRGVVSPWPEIVMKLLAKAPSDRYQCATDVLLDIRADRAPAQPPQSAQLPQQQVSQTVYAPVPPPSVQYPQVGQYSRQCVGCGTVFGSHLAQCPNCGRPAVSSQVFVQSSPGQVGLPAQHMVQDVRSNLVDAILVTMFCCMPLGVVAIVKAVEANSKKASGDYYGALEAYKESRKWTWWSFGIGFVCYALWLVCAVLSEWAGV